MIENHASNEHRLGIVQQIDACLTGRGVSSVAALNGAGGRRRWATACCWKEWRVERLSPSEVPSIKNLSSIRPALLPTNTHTKGVCEFGGTSTRPAVKSEN